MRVRYKSTGIVLGNYWGGGSGAYRAREYFSNISEIDLIEKNKKALKDGSLDSGMGYESLIGALITIETIKEIEIDGDIFINSSYKNIFIGKLSESQKDFLIEVSMS